MNPRLQPWQGCTLPLSYSRSRWFYANRFPAALSSQMPIFFCLPGHGEAGGVVALQEGVCYNIP